MVILDLDGTISDDSWRRHLLPDFDAYNAKCDSDLSMNRHLFVKPLNYAILTARPEKFRKQTEAWLHMFGVPYGWLFMRPDDSLLSSPELKLVQLGMLKFQAEMEIIAAYDDRPDVIEMYIKEGVPAHLITRQGSL